MAQLTHVMLVESSRSLPVWAEPGPADGHDMMLPVSCRLIAARA